MKKPLDYNKNVNIDLHIHSTASDGTFSPLEILNLAQSINLGAISITDHDTVAGTKEALAIGIPPSINFLTGVEISAVPPPPFSFPGSFHILGYAINIDDFILNQTLAKLQEARKNRNPRIIKLLNRMGFELTLNEIRKDFGECQLGRPHIAKQMVKKGFVQSVAEAFDKYLAKGQPAYIDKYRVDCDRAIEVIRNAGGIPVLAHPVLLEIKKDDVFKKLISRLKEMGLKGIEVYYPEHTPDLIARYTEIANRHGLLITGGTDFHGSIKPEIKMGSGRGNFSVPYELYEKLISSL
ncbi:MAG: 3',5'-nucleoside bisphosphate phosphatase [Desulfobacteraceae bacterium Eth-SRB2]|nr:MAG: 3',5'-nucleoside bisphosphate phosphatase [Desulfobacteraceae bacterium Eth-SRB2]